jgi:hypothetical protein
MPNFFWNDQENAHKCHLSNWYSLCQKKDKGGLGIPDLRDLNLCLLTSWVQRYHEEGTKLWKAIVDCKYHTCSPNLFCCKDRNSSPFWKGVMWAARAAKMGFRWKLGKGDKIIFWEDQWFGTCSLAIQFWDIYSIVNEQECTIKEAWDGVNLKFTFRRTVNVRVMNLWHELVQIASSISFNEEEDAIVWQYNSSGKYSVQSLYAIVNDRGMRQIFTRSCGRSMCHLGFIFSYGLVANNKTLSRDNLAKRRSVDDLTCLFCTELETTHHLFFDCCVARVMWETISEVMGVAIQPDFESMAKWWLKDKKCQCINICTSAVLWSLWKT